MMVERVIAIDGLTLAQGSLNAARASLTFTENAAPYKNKSYRELGPWQAGQKSAGERRVRKNTDRVSSIEGIVEGLTEKQRLRHKLFELVAQAFLGKLEENPEQSIEPEVIQTADRAQSLLSGGYTAMAQRIVLHPIPPITPK